jgi:hypothetical protein
MDVIGFLIVSLGSSTVQFRDSLGSRSTCDYSEAGFSSQKGYRDCRYTTNEQSSVVRSCGQKDLMQRIFIKKCFLCTVRSVCCVKRFSPVSRNILKDVRKSQMMPD